MAYEIPQELEYQEKIMFGLTFKQLMYAFVFGSISVLILKASGSIYLRVIFAMIPSTIGLGFMYLDFGTHLKNWWAWKKFKRAEIEDYQMQNYVGIKNMEDNLILTNDNRKLAILKIIPVNFSIKTDSEKHAITKSFQRFLNAIDFPIQIVIGTDKLDLKEYLDHIGKAGDKFVGFLEKYKENIHKTISQDKALNRSFYLVIPEQTNIDIQVKICEEKLRSIGLKTERLNSRELKALLALSLGGTCKGEDIYRFIAPQNIENKKDYIQINDTLNRIVCAHGYPRQVEAGFLDKIISSMGNFDLSIHISPYPIETMLVGLNRELQKQRADLYAAELKGVISPSLEIKYKDTRNVLEELQKGKEKLFNIGLYINCKVKINKDLEKAKEELDLLTKKVESELNALMIIPKIPRFRMSQGFKSIVPLATDGLKVVRNITTGALSAFFPFTSPFLQVDKKGVLWGVNKNNIPIIRDVFKLSNPNGCVLATSGAGKSYVSKLFVSRNLLNGSKVMVIDPQGEYDSLVKYFEGQTVKISRESKTMINPFDLMGHNYADKRLALMDIMSFMLGNLTDPQRAFIDKALTMAYKEARITNDSETWDNKPPIMLDLLKALRRLSGKVTAREKATIRSLTNRVEMYVNGVFSFMNQQTNIDFDNQFVSFNIKDMPKQVKPLMMFLILDYVYMKMRKDLKRKILVIDEAWSLLGRSEEASYIFEIVKTCRKFNLGLLLINQEVEGLLTSNAGRSVLANSAYTLLLRQKPAVIRNIQQTFDLSDNERDRLLTASPGEGIIILDNEHSEIKVVASQEEHGLITTKPEEIEEHELRRSINEDITKPKEEKKSQKKKEPSKIKVSEWGFIYKKSDLTKEDVQFLLNEGYKKSNHVSINSKRQETYLIKTRHNESADHLFLIFDIANHLKKFAKNVEIFETSKPDIIFELNDKKYAVEVETGQAYEKSKKKLLNKVDLLNKTYRENWFFVLTSVYFKSKYDKLGKTLLRKEVVPHLKKLSPKRKIKPTAL